jgi:hypothetical protein
MKKGHFRQNSEESMLYVDMQQENKDALLVNSVLQLALLELSQSKASQDLMDLEEPPDMISI